MATLYSMSFRTSTSRWGVFNQPLAKVILFDSKLTWKAEKCKTFYPKQIKKRMPTATSRPFYPANYIWKLSLLVSRFPSHLCFRAYCWKELHKKHSTLTFAKHLSSLCPATNCLATPHLSRHFNSVLKSICSDSDLTLPWFHYHYMIFYNIPFCPRVCLRHSPPQSWVAVAIRCKKIPLRSKGPDLNMQRRPRSETSTGLSQSTSSTECLGMNFVTIGAQLVRDCCRWQVPCAICN